MLRRTNLGGERGRAPGTEARPGGAEMKHGAEGAETTARGDAGTESGDGGRAEDPRSLGLRLRGKNINPRTLLATDYLNHFNEIVMLLELVPSMPECLQDAMDWAPKSYETHFRDSTFTDRDLAILGYRNAPESVRRPFDATVARMDEIVLDGRARIAEALAAGETQRLEGAVGEVSRRLQELIGLASAIIHGEARTMDRTRFEDSRDP